MTARSEPDAAEIGAVVVQPRPADGTETDAADAAPTPESPPDPAKAARKDESLKLIRRILAESLRPNWRSYAVGFFFLAVIAGMTAATAWIMRDIVNHIFVAKNATMVWVIAGAVLGIFILKGWATYMQSNILARVGNRIVAANQQRIYDHLLVMDLAFFTKQASSELIMRMSAGAQAARQVVDLVVQSFGRDVLSLIGLGVVMVLQAPLMSFFALLTAPIALVGILYLGRRVRSLSRAEMLSMAEIIGVLQETTHGARILKAFGLEPHMRGRMALAVAGVANRANKIAALQARTAPLMETLTGLAVATVILISGWQTVYYDRSPGEMLSFITALFLAYEPAKRLARLHIQLAVQLQGVRMMFELLDQTPGPTEAADAPDLVIAKGIVEFRDVAFSYKPDMPVIRGISFRANEGETVALVGRTGSGKTTIFNLVQRFYDVAAGTVLIDGVDVRSVSVRSLRGSIAFVSQDTYLFKGSIRDNIRLGRIDATDEEIDQVALQAHVSEFSDKMPDGLGSAIGENGVQLSGGQRQRIAIARAMLKNAPIILLDEATSALDSETERKVQEALGALTRGRTTLVIAHRLSTVVDADQIIVLEAGRIVEHGRHVDLVRNGGVYERLSRLQFSEAPGADEEARSAFA